MVRFGVPGQNIDPLSYGDSRRATVPVVQAPRAPGVTDKKFPLWCEWRTNKNSVGPTVEGEFWKLIRFESNGDATWVRFFAGGVAAGLIDLRDQVNTSVTVDAVTNEIDVDGGVVANGTNPSGIPLETVADVAGHTLDIQIQLATVVTPTPGDENDAGIACFNTNQFDIDATSGMVSLQGSTTAPPILTLTLDDSNAAAPDGVGDIDVVGTVVTNATNAKPLFTARTPANDDVDIQLQVATEITGAPGDTNDAGICSFDDTAFAVDADGYVTLAGGAGPAVDTVTGDDATAVSPDGAGNMNFNGAIVANATNAKPLFFDGDAPNNTQDLELQVSVDRTAAPADTNDAGICSFDDTDFLVDANGYVTLVGGGGGALTGITVDFVTGPGVNPVVPVAGVITINGNVVNNATNLNSPISTHSRATNVFDVDIQVADDVAPTPGDAFDAGIMSGDTNHFTIDNTTGFTQLKEETVIQEFTNIGYSLSAGTFTVHGADGTTLSDSNKGYVRVRDDAVLSGQTTVYEINRNFRVLDRNAGAGSQMAGNLFGLVSGDDWSSSNMPMFLCFIGNGSDAWAALCRLPYKNDSPLLADLGSAASATADGANSMFLLQRSDGVGGWDNPVLASFDDLPVTYIGGVRVNKDGVTNDWEFETMDRRDGPGRFYPRNSFVMPTGVNGAAAGSFWALNGGVAVPAVGTGATTYTWSIDGAYIRTTLSLLGWSVSGNGAVNALLALPPYSPRGSGSYPAGIGWYRDGAIANSIIIPYGNGSAATNMRLSRSYSAGDSVALQLNDINATFDLQINLDYQILNVE